MQQFVFAVFATMLVLPVGASDQTRVNFSGTWNMDPSRSESAHQAVPIGPVTIVIQQTDTELTLETRRKDANKPTVTGETLVFKLDGTESTSKGMSGVPVQVKAHWDGAKLVTETARNIEGSSITTMQVFSLDPAAKELTIDKTLTVQHGYQFQGAKTTGRGKDVYVRARGSAKK